MKFVYVFNNEDKEKLLKRGFVLLKNDTRNSVFVFAYKANDTLSFDLLDGLSKYSLSNTLTF